MGQPWSWFGVESPYGIHIVSIDPADWLCFLIFFLSWWLVYCVWSWPMVDFRNSGPWPFRVKPKVGRPFRFSVVPRGPVDAVDLGAHCDGRCQADGSWIIFLWSSHPTLIDETFSYSLVQVCMLWLHNCPLLILQYFSLDIEAVAISKSVACAFWTARFQKYLLYFIKILGWWTAASGWWPYFPGSDNERFDW